MTLRHLPASARIATPWRNGGGLTREVAVAPLAAGNGRAGFRWRVSIADVDTDGPFSAFPGYQRIVAVLRGAGMALTVDGVETIIARHRPFTFSGVASTTCRLLDGPVLDFNVIAAVGRAVRVTIASPPAELVRVSRAVVVALDEPAVVRANSMSVDLAPLDAVDVAGEPSLSCESAGPIAMVVFPSTGPR